MRESRVLIVVLLSLVFGSAAGQEDQEERDETTLWCLFPQETDWKTRMTFAVRPDFRQPSVQGPPSLTIHLTKMLLRARDPDLRFELSSEPPRSLAGYDLDSALSRRETSPATRFLNEAAGVYLRHFRTKPIRRIRGPEYDWFNIDFTEPPDARIRCCSPCCP